MSRVRTIVKVGGSLISHPSVLNGLLQTLSDLRERSDFIVTIGSGQLPQALRAEVEPAVEPSPVASFQAALLARDALAEYIAGRYPAFCLFDHLSAVRSIIASGHIPLLRQSHFVNVAWPAPGTRELSTDSVSVLAAGLLGACQVVLLKNERGIFPSYPPPPGQPPFQEITTAELRNLPSKGVDDLLAPLLDRFALKCLFADGHDVDNLARSIAFMTSRGTWILPSRANSERDYAEEIYK